MGGAHAVWLRRQVEAERWRLSDDACECGVWVSSGIGAVRSPDLSCLLQFYFGYSVGGRYSIQKNDTLTH